MKPLSFEQLEQAYIKVYENAVELIEESKILLNNKKYARAYYLAQIATEEIGKLPIIFQEATKSYYKETHDWKIFYKRLRSHIDKNSMSQTFLQFPDFNPNEIKQQSERLNILKNGSLYADLDGDSYIKPSDIVTMEFVNSRLEVAESYLNEMSKANHHIKGSMEKYLNSDKAKNIRELFIKKGWI